jgi:hypothetical protein
MRLGEAAAPRLSLHRNKMPHNTSQSHHLKVRRLSVME